jgi:hypothetical protein
MKKLILALIFVLITAFSAFAGGYEAVTVAGTSIALTSATYGRARSALCRLETAPIRYTIDGATTPTSSVGIVLYPLEWIILESANDIRNFRGIRTTDTSGSLKCFYID